MNLLSYVHLRNIHGSTGAGRVARQLTEHLASRANVHILADAADYSTIVPKVGQPWASFHYHLFSSDTSRQQARWLFTHRPPAEQFWPEVQVVHCTMESYVPKRRCRLVVTVHDAAYFDQGAHPVSMSTLRQRWKWKILYRTLAREADLFHTVSQFSADRLATLFPAIRSRLRVVHNAPAPRFADPVGADGKAYLEQHGFDAAPYVFLPGGLSFRKNAGLVLETWPLVEKQHPGLRLVVAGHSDPGFAARAKEISQSIRLVGYVDDECLCALYHAARVVWFPSRYEGFGLPVVEAMVCGTPVVASRTSSIPEVAGDAALLAAPDSPAEHMERLDVVIRDQSVRAELIRRGQERSRQFSWDRSAGELYQLFSTLL